MCFAFESQPSYRMLSFYLSSPSRALTACQAGLPQLRRSPRLSKPSRSTRWLMSGRIARMAAHHSAWDIPIRGSDFGSRPEAPHGLSSVRTPLKLRSENTASSLLHAGRAKRRAVWKATSNPLALTPASRRARQTRQRPTLRRRRGTTAPAYSRSRWRAWRHSNSSSNRPCSRTQASCSYRRP